MRPYSHYLDSLSHECVKAKYHLAGSTPPPPENWPKNMKLVKHESPNSNEFQSVMRRLARMCDSLPAELALSPGSSQAMFQALAATCAPGDKIIIETPVYEPFVATAKFLGLRIVHFKRRGVFAHDFKEICKQARHARAILISNPHCPSGHLYTAQELKKIARIGPKLIVDEVYLPLFSNGCLSLVNSRNTISVSGLSKSTGLSNLRLGWVKADSKTIIDINRVALNLNIAMPMASLQLADLALIKWKSLISPIQDRAQINRALVEAFSKNHPTVMLGRFDLGNFLTLKVPKKFTSGAEFSNALLRRSVWVRAGENFFQPKTIRLHLMLEPKKFKKAFQIIEELYE